LIRYLISNIEGEDVILPKTNDGFQPLHAIYSKNCQKAIKIILEEGKNKILDFYPMVKVKIIEEDKFKNLDPELKSFININTPEELKILIEENPT
ncbi:MAG: molybdenum cofactor guanylyltransferase, partial [Thermodesulfobacteriota bacterium]